MNAKMPAAIAAAMALVFILGLAAPARTAPAWYPRSVALVIGVTPYGGGFRTLPSARESAQNIENTLRANGFQVLTLYDRQATRDAIVGFLTSPLVRGLGPQDRFVFYFAGHGHTVTGVGLDGATGFIVPADGNRLGGEPDLRTLVGVRELQKELATRTAVKQATFIFDAQFEDAAVKPVSRDAVSPLSYVGQPASNVLIAGGAFSAFGGADLFSNAVAAAFNGYADANRDGFVTFGEVATYVEAVTGRQQSRRVIAGSFEGGGQLVFKYAGEPPVMVASATPALPTPARDAPGTPAALGGRVTLPPEQARTAAVAPAPPAKTANAAVPTSSGPPDRAADIPPATPPPVIVASVAPPAMPAASNQPSAVSDQPTVPVPPPAAPEPPAVAPVPVAEPEEASDDDSPGVTAIAAVPEDKGEQLTDQQIKGVIASRVKIFTHCFFMGVRENPKMSGYAMMNFTINPNGSVGAAYLKSSSLASPVAEDCLVARMKRVQFPSFNGKPQDVSFPFKYIQ